MAITKEYNLKISTKQAQANIDELNKSLEDTTNSIKNTTTGISNHLNNTHVLLFLHTIRSFLF